jgi:hypothetical protein
VIADPLGHHTESIVDGEMVGVTDRGGSLAGTACPCCEAGRSRYPKGEFPRIANRQLRGRIVVVPPPDEYTEAQ